MKNLYFLLIDKIKKIDAVSFAAFLAFVLLSMTLYCGLTPLDGENELYSGIIRFHVLANSDSEQDQALKLKVRDCVNAYTTKLLEDCSSIDQAKRIISQNRNVILETAKSCIEEQGYLYDVEFTEGYEIYPRRIYGKYSFPSGRYYSVRLSIGEGNGKNWWCVLFPPLCRAGATVERFEDLNELKSVGFTENEIEIITEEKSTRTEIRYFFLDFINGLK